MNLQQTRDYLNGILNAIYSRGTTGEVAGKIITATQAIREAITIVEIELLNDQFQERKKGEFIMIYEPYAKKWQVGNYWMFEAYYNSSDKRNLAGEFETPQFAQSFIDKIEAGQIELDEYLTHLESLHP